MAIYNSHILLAATLCGAIALAAAPLSGGDAPTSNDDLKAQAEAIFADLVERYRGLASYSDTASIEFDVEVAEGTDFFGGAMPSQEARLAYAAPNRIAVDSEHMQVFSDGETVWLHVPMFGQYKKREAGSTWAEVLLGDGGEMLLQSLFHPVLTYLIHGHERAEDFQTELVEVHAIEAAERDGKPGTLIRGTGDSPQYRMMFDDPIPFEVWIDEETGLLGEAAADMTAVYNHFAEQMAEFAFDDDDDDMADDMTMPTYERFRMIAKLKDVRINDEIPAERFAFEPDDDLRLVEDFEFMGSRGSSQLVLIGETAPDFTLPTLEGDELTLSDLRGSVVLLDFWALWCAPCVQALPHVQKIADRFEDQPVIVLGVNRDPEGSEDRINRMLERREITFGPHVLDIDGEAAELFHVSGIPCTILIDKEGIVQDVGVGFHPGKVDEISEKIEKLLAGEQLHTPEEIAEMRARAEEDDDEPAVFFGGDRKAQREVEEAIAEAIGEAPGRLEPLPLPRSVRQNAWHLKLIDIEGDGVKKAVVPHQRGLHIIDLNERSSERITFSGLSSGAAIQSFGMVRLDNEVHWLVSTARHGMFGSRGGTFGMFNAEGESVWTFAPDLPRDMMASFGEPVAADLTGDGQPEIVVTLQAMRMGRGRQQMMPQGQASQIIVFTADGEVLARRPVGGYVYGLHVVDAPADAEHPRQTVICISDGRAMWLEYSDATAEVSLRP